MDTNELTMPDIVSTFEICGLKLCLLANKLGNTLANKDALRAFEEILTCAERMIEPGTTSMDDIKLLEQVTTFTTSSLTRRGFIKADPFFIRPDYSSLNTIYYWLPHQVNG